MVWYSKIDRKAFTIFLGVLLVMFLLAGFIKGEDGYFWNNISPEVSGVLIELLIILLIFDRWQEHNKRKKLISLERRLREYLIFFLKHNFKSLPKELRVGRFFGKDHEKNIEEIESLHKYISENGLSETEIISIQEHCAREAETFGNLLPVASELTNEHFKAWCRIVYFTNCIANRKEPIGRATIDILQNIKRFDTASFERGLYVGAENV